MVGHGTKVTHIISQSLPDADYIVCGMGHLKALKAAKLSETVRALSEKVREAIDQGASAINLSCGFEESGQKLSVAQEWQADKVSEPWLEVLKYAESKEVPIFWARGNEGKSFLYNSLDANSDALFSVGSTQEVGGTISSFSFSRPKYPAAIGGSGNGDLKTIGAKVERNRFGFKTVSPTMKDMENEGTSLPLLMSWRFMEWFSRLVSIRD